MNNKKSSYTIQSIKEKNTYIDENGHEQTTILEQTIKRERSEEPDYIKLYTNMWCEFNEIPVVYRPLFLSLISRMSYCNSNDLDNSQLVNTGKPWSESIMKECGWTSSDSLMKGLKALVKCEAIKKVGRGVYQINPSYAGRGQWKYNPRLAQGGIEDLIATFNFKNKTVSTKIVWADDGQASESNTDMRTALEVDSDDNAVLKDITVTPNNKKSA